MTIAEVKKEIQTRYPDIDFIDKSKSDDLYFEFTYPTQHEYKFEIYFYDLNTLGVNAAIHASLHSDNDSSYFWYYPLDPYGSDNIADKENDCREFLFDTLDILAKHKTRIIQKKGWLSQTFICEYLDNNTWEILYKNSALNFTGFKFPKIKGRQKIYQ